MVSISAIISTSGIILALVLISAFNSQAQAYSLMGDNLRLAQYNNQITENVNLIGTNAKKQDENINNSHFKDPSHAFKLTLFPAFSGLLLFVLVRGDVPDWVRYPGVAVLASATIPAHLYVEDPFLKYVGIDLVKFLGLSAFVYGIPGAIVCSIENCDNGGSGGLALLGLITSAAVYIFELIDVPMTAQDYNEKLKWKENFYIKPTSWKGEYIVNVGYEF